MITIIRARNLILAASALVCLAGILARRLIDAATRVHPDEIDLGVIAP